MGLFLFFKLPKISFLHKLFGGTNKAEIYDSSEANIPRIPIWIIDEIKGSSEILLIGFLFPFIS